MGADFKKLLCQIDPSGRLPETVRDASPEDLAKYIGSFQNRLNHLSSESEVSSSEDNDTSIADPSPVSHSRSPIKLKKRKRGGVNRRPAATKVQAIDPTTADLPPPTQLPSTTDPTPTPLPPSTPLPPPSPPEMNLSHSDDDASDADQPQTRNPPTNPPADSSKKNIPPIVLIDTLLWPSLATQLDQEKIKFNEATNSNQGLKIYPTTADDHLKLTTLLNKQNIPIHTYPLPNQRRLNVIIHGLPSTTTTEDISEDLKAP